MKRLVLILLLLAQAASVQPALLQPALAQMKLAPKDAGKRADVCAPIGRTEDGKLVYAMTCATPPRPAAAAVPSQPQPQPGSMTTSPEPEKMEVQPETERSGLFGLSYDRRPRQ
jgi:hypothetical protein